MPHLRPIAAVFVAVVTATAAIAVPIANTVVAPVGDRYRLVAQNDAGGQRGIALPTWQVNGYATNSATQAIGAIAGVGANWIQLVPTWNMANKTSNTIDGTYSVTDAALLGAISGAHAKGLKVLLKPHVDPRDGTPRWQINPSDPAEWFTSYQSMITHYAAIAQQTGVEEFSVGCELTTMSGSAARGSWLTVINAIKALYQGPLVYAAQANEYTNVSFWDQLNFIGVDAYFPLSTFPTTNISALEAAWVPIQQQLSAFAASLGRQILFTEAGYPSQIGAAVQPWNNQQISFPSQREQAAAYQALLTAFSGQTWWAGVFWWSWWTDAGNYYPLDFAIGGKLAQLVLQNAWAPGTHTCPWQLPGFAVLRALFGC